MTEPGIDFPIPSDKDAIMSTPAGQSQHVLVTANRYAGNPRNDYRGALVEETSAFRSDVELFYDYHTLVWDADLGETHDVRNDAVASGLDWASPRVPELVLENEFAFGDGTVSWNSNLQWSQATSLLLVESHCRGEPYGPVPAE